MRIISTNNLKKISQGLRKISIQCKDLAVSIVKNPKNLKKTAQGLRKISSQCRDLALFIEYLASEEE